MKVTILGVHFRSRLYYKSEMKFVYKSFGPPADITDSDWNSWSWQMRNGLKSLGDYQRYFELSEEEKSFFARNESANFQAVSDDSTATNPLFNVRTTPYYARIGHENPSIRRIQMPDLKELTTEFQSELDPLGEKKNNPVPRIIHRYSDRVLFLVTDVCSVYCRYCTRKHFTGQNQALPKADEYTKALDYIRTHTGIREVILSGGDPLTLSDGHLVKIISDIRAIEHVEIIRIGTRMPVVAPMRVTEELVKTLKKYHPIFMMVHFNHPAEITQESALALTRLVDNGFPVMNQMVLLNGVNNHEIIVQALSRRLLSLRVKPYYMFQCDPSEGTDHLRTSLEDSLEIQKKLWGHLSGLAMPTLSLDIPNGGGKTYFVPDFLQSKEENKLNFKGWDGVESTYVNPTSDKIRRPVDYELYIKEWEDLKSSRQPL